MKTLAEKKNKTYKITLAIFVFLLVASLGSGMFYASRIGAEVSKITTEAKYLDIESSKKTDIAQKYARVENYSPLVFNALPTSKDISAYIATLEEVAKKDSINISNSTYGNKTGDKKSSNLDLSQTISQKEYYELPIKLTVDGSYEKFLQFMDDLKSLNRLNTISNISVVKNTTDAGSDQVQVNFTDSIYIKK